MSRPFGVALLLGGWDENGPVLLHADPSGTFVRYYAKAIGSGSEGAQTNLQESYQSFLIPLNSFQISLFRKDLTLKEAEVMALSTLKQVSIVP